MPAKGEIFVHKNDPDVYARVESFGPYRVYFSLWEVSRPGWQGGAALHRKDFEAIYSDGPYPEEYVQGATTERQRQAEEAAAYERMVSAPLRPETIEALNKRLASGDHPVAKAPGAGMRERWREWWDTLSEEERQAARDTLPDPEPESKKTGPRYGGMPSYRCFIGRHRECEPDGPERGCTCKCGHPGLEKDGGD